MSQSGVVQSLDQLPKRFLNTYWYAAGGLAGRPSNLSRPEMLDAGTFQLSCSVLMVLALAIGIMCVTGLDLVSSGLVNMTSPSAMFSTIRDTTSQVADELAARRIERESIVVVGSVLICFAAGLASAAIWTLHTTGRRGFGARFKENCYVLGVMETRCAVAWVVLALVIAGWRLFSQRPGHHLAVLQGVLVACDVVIPLAWTNGAHRWISKTWRMPNRSLPIWCTLPILVATVTLMVIPSAVQDRFQPEITFKLSPRCGDGECFAYVRSEHARTLYLDMPLNVLIKSANVKDSGAVGEYRVIGTAEITLSPVSSSNPFVVLEPDSEQVVKVDRVRLDCHGQRGSLTGYPGAFGVGKSTTVHLPGRDDLALINIRVRGAIQALLRQAADCS